MALKKTVVAADCKTGPSEIIDGNNGTLISPDNPNNLTHAIINYIENPIIAKEHAKNAYKTVKLHFVLRRQLVKIEQVVKYTKI
jgi:glycosyltransferase involved in cell wall biosynthesis